MNVLRKNQGFTIVELLIVIVVIGILAAITIVSYTGISQRAVAASLRSDLENTVKQLKLYQIDKGVYPTLIGDCPVPAAGNMCLKSSPGNSYQYTPYNSASSQSFVVNAVNGSQLYVSGQNGATVAAGQNLLPNSAVERTGVNEFLQYADMAPIIDSWGMLQYTISFDIKSANTSSAGNVQVYMQNGSGAKYTFEVTIPVTTTYTRRSVTVVPSMQNATLTQSILAYYGYYGSGNILSVKNVKIELGPTATDWTAAP
jgi:prepilin-type N-terminal cleavage/methylation domain-containing protein